MGNRVWLRHRLAVISAEECYPLSSILSPHSTDFKDLYHVLLSLTKACKDKSAAGLGALAFELSKGDRSVLSGTDEDVHIKIVTAGVQRPIAFWSWVATQCVSDDQKALINNMRYFFDKGGLPWDKAFFVASAYLSIVYSEKSVIVNSELEADTPVWVAFDKHTREGCSILKNVSLINKIDYKLLSVINFYFESSLTNCIVNSYWWDREMKWRLGKFKLSLKEAIALWESVRPQFVSEVLPYALSLQRYLDAVEIEQPWIY